MKFSFPPAKRFYCVGSYRKNSIGTTNVHGTISGKNITDTKRRFDLFLNASKHLLLLFGWHMFSPRSTCLSHGT
jgi:hypothetical protein